MNVSPSSSLTHSIDSHPIHQLALQLEDHRQTALTLRCFTQYDHSAEEGRGLAAGHDFLTRSLRQHEKAIARIEKAWIDRLIRLEQSALHYFGAFPREAQPTTPRQSNPETAPGLPPEIWARIIEFLAFDPDTLDSLAQVNRDTGRSVTEGFRWVCQAALSDPVMQPFVEQSRPFGLEDKVVELERAVSRVRDPAFLLTAEGWFWTHQARASQRSTLLRLAGEDMVQAAAYQVCALDATAAPAWWSDRLFAVACALQSASNLSLVAADLREDRSFAKEACRRVPRALSHLPPHWRNDLEVLEQAIHQPGPDILSHPLMMASDELKDDERLAKKAIAISWAAFCWVSDRLKDNKNLALEAVALCHEAYGFVSRRLQSDVDVALVTIQNDPMSFWRLPPSVMNHPLIREHRPARRPGEPSAPADGRSHA
jgi:hypothetical protein